MQKHDVNTFVRGAMLLVLAGFISKVLSAGYRIPLQNLTGDIGFYIYQQVYPILGMATALALYGFPAAVSQIAARRRAANQSLSMKHFIIPIGLILFVCNGAVFLLLFSQADTLAGWVGDRKLAAAYRLTAFIFLLLPFLVLLRGWFQAQENMKPTAFSQVIEQLVRVSIIIAAAIWVAKGNKDLYHIASAGGVAAICGAIAAVLLLLLYMLRQHSPLKVPAEAAVDWWYYIRTIVVFGIVQAMTHMVLLIIQFADTFTLLPALMEGGFSKAQAMQAKGIFDRGQPLIQFGMVMGSSFALALIPNIAKMRTKESDTVFLDNIKIALSFGFYIAAGATLGLILLFPEVNLLLYRDMSGTNSLQLLVLSIVLSSIVITAASILQGLGQIKQTAIFIVLAFIGKWAANRIFVPWWGITGSALATVMALTFLCLLILRQLKRRLHHFSWVRHIRWFSLIGASMVMTGFIIACKYILPDTGSLSRLQLFCTLLPMIVVGGLIYVITLVKLKAFSQKELEMLPLVSKFTKQK